jgi:hypothetical protein
MGVWISEWNCEGSQRVTDGLRGTDAEGIARWIDPYCEAHPLDNVETATDALALELMHNSN